MGLILEHFLKFLLSYGLRKTNVRKRSPPDSPLKMCSYAAEVFSAVLPRILKLNARSHAPEFVYIHAPPAPYKSTSKASHVKAESEHRPSKRRFIFTGAEVEVLLQDVDVSILFHYGYINAIQFSAY